MLSQFHMMPFHREDALQYMQLGTVRQERTVLTPLRVRKTTKMKFDYRRPSDGRCSPEYQIDARQKRLRVDLPDCNPHVGQVREAGNPPWQLKEQGLHCQVSGPLRRPAMRAMLYIQAQR